LKKQTFVFIVLACIFVSNVILAEFIGVKIFSLESTLGWEAFHWNIYGMPVNLTYTCGVIIWPVVFVLTDIINDYYGRNGVRLLTYIAVGITIYAFVVSNLAIHTSPASWWTTIMKDQGVPDYNLAYKAVFGQGNNIIVGSLIAFILGQFTDVFIFQKIKERSKSGALWIRATLSTLVSQLIDSFVVIYVAFYLGQNWPLSQVMNVAVNNYIYKGIIALAMIPVLHLIHKLLENYFGKELSEKLRDSAMKNESNI
jgi:queuosine precursor transporter